MSEARIRALQIIAKSPGIRPRYFAKQMWPDSECWKYNVKCGQGSHKGGGMYLAAGGLLGKLRRDKLITSDNWLTQKGIEHLQSLQEQAA